MNISIRKWKETKGRIEELESQRDALHNELARVRHECDVAVESAQGDRDLIKANLERTLNLLKLAASDYRVLMAEKARMQLKLEMADWHEPSAEWLSVADGGK